MTRKSLRTRAYERAASLAKLMAQEKILVTFGNIKTASFDIVNRVLRLPLWDIPEVQMDLLVGHEVSHALNSPGEAFSYHKASQNPTKGMWSYFNIIEDVRIEKKIRVIYPGMNRVFYEGYKAFTQDGPIFRVIDRNTVEFGSKHFAVRSLPLIDRINLFYKIGAFIDVPFKSDEEHWLTRIDGVVTWQQAYQVASDLYVHEQQQATNYESDEMEESDESDESDESEDSDGASGDDADSDGEGDEASEDDSDGEGNSSSETDDEGEPAKKGKPAKKSPKNPKGNPAPSSVTDEMSQDALASKVSPTQFTNLTFGRYSNDYVNNRTVSVTDWMKDCQAAYRSANHGMALKVWQSEFLSLAKAMAADFHRRKTAKNLRHARVGKTGKLNPTMLSKYQVAEDLFKRVMTVPNGQSHGIVMLVDGSDSMRSTFSGVLSQALLFGTFAFYAQIPFRCYIFSDQSYPGLNLNAVRADRSIVTPQASTHLLTVLDTAVRRNLFMRQAEQLAEMMMVFAQGRSSTMPGSNLGGTPLYSGMLLAEHHMATMKEKLRLDKMTFVVLSDGGDTNGVEFELAAVRANYMTKADTMVFSDMVTRRNYTPEGSNWFMSTLFKMITDRNDARGMYIYLSPSIVAASMLIRKNMDSNTLHDLEKKLDTNHMVVVPDGVTDCCAVMEPMAPKNEQFTSSGKTAAKVIEDFAKHQRTGIASRLLTNSIMPFLA